MYTLASVYIRMKNVNFLICGFHSMKVGAAGLSPNLACGKTGLGSVFSGDN